MSAINDLKAQVAANTAVTQAAIALINQLSSQPNNDAEIAQAAADLKAAQEALGAVVSAAPQIPAL